MTGILVFLAFAAGFGLVFGLNLLYSELKSEREKVRRDAQRQQVRTRQVERARIAVQNRELYEMAAAGSADQRTPSMQERIELFFEQAGIKMSPLRSLIWTILTAAILATFIGLGTQSAVASALVAAVTLTGPMFVISYIRRQRLEKLLSQLPEAFDMISRMMRAGQPFAKSMEVTANEADAPLSEELGYTCDQQRLGLTADAALRDLARRTGLLEIRIFVLAVLVQRQTGGNMAELLENLAQIIRERYRVRGIISALTAEGRFQAYILLALPFVMLIALTVINPTYVRELYSRPWILASTGLAMLVGTLWMRRIVNFNF